MLQKENLKKCTASDISWMYDMLVITSTWPYRRGNSTLTTWSPNSPNIVVCQFHLALIRTFTLSHKTGIWPHSVIPGLFILWGGLDRNIPWVFLRKLHLCVTVEMKLFVNIACGIHWLMFCVRRTNYNPSLGRIGSDFCTFQSDNFRKAKQRFSDGKI